ncbi:MAG: hypothetical protein R6X25_12330 [Candidatus Krumholzibacteriia bacterium]
MRIVIAAIILLAATSAAAQNPWDNFLTFQWDPASNAYCPNCEYEQNDTIISVTLWLIRPYNTTFGAGEVRAVENVSGFDCRVTVTEGATILGWETDVPALIYIGGADVLVRYDEPRPVIDGRLALATCNMYIGNVTSFELPTEPMPRCCYHDNCWVTVAPSTLSAIEGEVTYLDADDPVDPYAVANHFGPNEDFEFQIYQAPVAAEGTTWGRVKGLYR